MNKYNKIMQYFWLVVAVLSGVYAIVTVTQSDETDPLVFFMPVLALILFAMRKWYNGKVENRD